jgi:hypothetical protein
MSGGRRSRRPGCCRSGGSGSSAGSKVPCTVDFTNGGVREKLEQTLREIEIAVATAGTL